MIQIELEVDEADTIRSCRALGHAEAGARGGDIVCAAVSVLMRAFLRASEIHAGISVESEAPCEGFIAFRARWTDEGRDFLAALSAFLIEGLRSVAEEFPQKCKILIRRS